MASVKILIVHIFLRAVSESMFQLTNLISQNLK
jgi:hypothetical protein